MHFNGTTEFDASRQRVWAFLVDPTNFGPCSPVPISRTEGDHYQVQARVGSGFLSTTLRVALEVTDVVDDRSARLVGQGGASGIGVEATTTFEVRDGAAEGTCVVEWDVDVRLSGGFAGAASRLIEQHAPGAIDQLIGCVREQVGRSEVGA